MGINELKKKSWWRYLDESQQELLQESFMLLEREENPTSSAIEFHDYAFVVFPAAKAYEGILKKLLLDLKLIQKRQYLSNHFRIGRALNPNLPQRYRSNWVWEKLAKSCGGESLPNALWDTWRESRNLVFHWFPDHKNSITLSEAKMRIELIMKAVDRAFENCKVPQVSKVTKVSQE